MIPPAFFRLAQRHAQEMPAEPGRKRLLYGAPPHDLSRVIVTAVVLAAVVTVAIAALMLRSILILGGFGAS